jgi:hypothetical protein
MCSGDGLCLEVDRAVTNNPFGTVLEWAFSLVPMTSLTELLHYH